MTNFKLLIVLFIILISSCKNRKPINDNLSKNKSKVEVTEFVKTDCKCFNGIGSSKGDTAILTMKFSNGQNISICGFLDKKMEGIILSEFNVFDCNSGKSLTEYDATQICRIMEKSDTLIIQELKYLPTGKNWTWNLIQIGEQIITTEDKEILTAELLPKLEKFTIDDNDIQVFLNSLKKGSGHNSEWELEIGKLETLTLLGNEKAKSILENYEEFTGQKTDGALAETWKDAKATTQWIKK